MLFAEINYLEWSEEIKVEKDNQLSEIVGFLRAESLQLYGTRNIEKFKSDWVNGAKFQKKHDACFEKLLLLENEYISAYIGQIIAITRSFYRTNGRRFNYLSEEDFQQQGMIYCVSAIYNFDGSAKFITYLTTVLKRSLSGWLLNQENHQGISPRIAKLRRLIRRQMNDMSFEEAVEYIRSSDIYISDDECKKVNHAIYHIRNLTGLTTFPTYADVDLIEKLEEAIERAGLSELEKDLVLAYKTGDRTLRAQLSRERINPRTGRVYTKQVLGQRFNRACQKLKNYMIEN